MLLSFTLTLGSEAALALRNPLKTAAPSELPHVVMVTSNMKGKCGGVLLAPQVVLTAAHCLNTRNLNEKFFVTPKNTGSEVAIETLFPLVSSHAGRFDSQMHFEDALSDLGVLILLKPVELNTYPKLNFRKVPEGSLLKLTGYSGMPLAFGILALGHNSVVTIPEAPHLLGFRAEIKELLSKALDKTLHIEGDSGSPVFDPESNEVVGVTTALIKASEVLREDEAMSAAYPLSTPEALEFLRSVKLKYPNETKDIMIPEEKL